MADIINTNVFPLSTELYGIKRGNAFVDFAGLDYFWELAKNYVDVADRALAGRATALENTVGDSTKGLVKDLADLKTTVEALGGAEGGIQGMIDASIAKLDVTDTAVAGEYVSSVSEADGKISVTRVALPDYTDTYDAKGSAATALTDAKTYVDDIVGVYASEGVVATGLRKDISDVATDLSGHKADAAAHITADERTSWNAAKTAIDVFLKDAELDAEGKNVLDTLKELQSYMASDTTAASELVNRVGALETTVGDAESGLVKTVADMDAAYKLADTTLQGNINTVAGNLATLSGTVADMDAAYKAADTKIREDFAAADTKIREDFAAADSALETALKKYADDAEAQALADAKTHIAEVIASYYTKTEVDNALELKANLSYVNDELAKKADKSTTYTKTDVNDLLSANSTADQTYAKTYTDLLFASIKFVSKDQIDGLFA